MALPEYSFGAGAYVLEPSDLTPETMEAFARYCAQTEKGLLKDIMRENIIIEMPATSRGLEDDIFRSVWEDV